MIATINLSCPEACGIFICVVGVIALIAWIAGDKPPKKRDREDT